MKRNRQEKLLELISRYEIETQDELIEKLRENGYQATQATISRDIRELQIAKMTTGRGAVAGGQLQRGTDRFHYQLTGGTEYCGAENLSESCPGCGGGN